MWSMLLSPLICSASISKAKTFPVLNRNLGKLVSKHLWTHFLLYPQKTVTEEGREENGLESLAGL